MAQPFSHFVCHAPSLPIKQTRQLEPSPHQSFFTTSTLSDQQQRTPTLRRSSLLARHNPRGQQCTCHHHPCKPALSPHRPVSADSCSTRELAFPARPSSLWRSNTATSASPRHTLPAAACDPLPQFCSRCPYVIQHQAWAAAPFSKQRTQPHLNLVISHQCHRQAAATMNHT